MKRAIEVGGIAAVILLSGVAGYVLSTARDVGTLALSTIVVFIAGACGILLAVERLNRRR